MLHTSQACSSLWCALLIWNSTPQGLSVHVNMQGTSGRKIGELRGHTSSVSHIALDPAHNHIFTLSTDKSIKVGSMHCSGINCRGKLPGNVLCSDDFVIRLCMQCNWQHHQWAYSIRFSGAYWMCLLLQSAVGAACPVQTAHVTWPTQMSVTVLGQAVTPCQLAQLLIRYIFAFLPACLPAFLLLLVGVGPAEPPLLADHHTGEPAGRLQHL